MPQFVKFPVENRQEFRAFWKERMTPDLSLRIGPGWKQILKEAREQPCPLFVISDRWGGFFGPLRNLTGVERLCMLFHDDPAFVEEMMDATAEFIIRIMDQILDVVPIDVYGFWEDMAFHTAPLIGPEMVRRYMLPRYRRVIDFLKGRGVPFICLDSDGKIDSLIPIWMDAGVDALYPFESASGMDVIKVRRTFGKDLRIWGGFDKRKLVAGPAAIDAELERLLPLMAEGGYIPHLDHSAPPDISFANFSYFMRRLGETVQEI